MSGDRAVVPGFYGSRADGIVADILAGRFRYHRRGGGARRRDQGSGEMNIIVGVHSDQFERAVQAIYDCFVGGGAALPSVSGAPVPRGSPW